MTLGCGDACFDAQLRAAFGSPPIRRLGIGIDTVVMGPRLPCPDQTRIIQTLTQPISTKRRQIRAGDKVFHCV